jgi:hypothetical protein
MENKKILVVLWAILHPFVELFLISTHSLSTLTNIKSKWKDIT